MIEEEIIVQNNPKSPISEMFKNLRTNIQFMSSSGDLKTLLITSTLPGEGKSWISSNLAVTFAQTGKAVCLVDADMRKGRQHKIFNLKKAPGLSNYLSGYYNGYEDKERYLANYLQETDIKNLFLITAGTLPPNPSELLVSENMTKLLENLKEICDVIIIDGPPSQLVTDSIVISRIVDSTVIVVESKKTKKENLRDIVNNIKNVGGKIAGVVINKTEFSNKDYKYSYYYGSTKEKSEKEKDIGRLFRIDELIHKEKLRNETIKKEQVAYQARNETELQKQKRAEEIRKMLEEEQLKKEQEKQIEKEKKAKAAEERKLKQEEDKKRRKEELEKIKAFLKIKKQAAEPPLIFHKDEAEEKEVENIEFTETFAPQIIEKPQVELVEEAPQEETFLEEAAKPIEVQEEAQIEEEQLEPPLIDEEMLQNEKKLEKAERLEAEIDKDNTETKLVEATEETETQVVNEEFPEEHEDIATLMENYNVNQPQEADEEFFRNEATPQEQQAKTENLEELKEIAKEEAARKEEQELNNKVEKLVTEINDFFNAQENSLNK